MLLRSATWRALATAIVLLAALLGTAAAAPAARAATLTGLAFKDFDRDGTWQTSEPVLSDQQLYLFLPDGTAIAAATTDPFGRYTFSGIADGDYRVAYASPSWWALRNQWVPTTTGSIKPSRNVTVSGTATADFGWREIVRSTDPFAPISSYTAPSGLKVNSYDDVVSAREIHDALAQARIGAEAPFVEVRFDLSASNMTNASASSSNGGPYTDYAAMSYVSYDSWLDRGDRTLTHEYGHAWSQYYAYIVQQDPTLQAYLGARGLAGDSRVGSSYAWDPNEMIAEDYRQLFGSANAAAGAQINTEIPRAAEVAGLADFLATTFTTTPSSSPPPPPPPPTSPPPPPPPPPPAPPPPPPSPPPLAAPSLQVSAVAMSPDPVKTTGTASASLSAPGTVTARILTAKGALVRTLLAQVAKPAGAIGVAWDKRDAAGRRVGKGSYVLEVTATDAGGQSARATAAFGVA